MTAVDRSARLHAAVMGALLLLDTDDDSELANTIVAAVEAVLAEDEKEWLEEWGYRFPNGQIGALSTFIDEEIARSAEAQARGVKAIRRRVTPWEER